MESLPSTDALRSLMQQDGFRKTSPRHRLVLSCLRLGLEPEYVTSVLSQFTCAPVFDWQAAALEILQGGLRVYDFDVIKEPSVTSVETTYSGFISCISLVARRCILWTRKHCLAERRKLHYWWRQKQDTIPTETAPASPFWGRPICRILWQSSVSKAAFTSRTSMHRHCQQSEQYWNGR